MSKPRQFWILENRCAMPMRCYETALEAFNEMEGNDDVATVIEFSAYQSAIEELKAAREALDTCYMQFADRIARVKAPEPYMLEECQQARLRIDKFLKEIE